MPSYKVAIVWRGDREGRRNATPANNRFHRVFEELAAIGIHAEPAVYDEEFAEEGGGFGFPFDGVVHEDHHFGNGGVEAHAVEVFGDFLDGRVKGL